MTSRKNRFGFESIEDIPVGPMPRRRGAGPMSAAVRETAESLAESTEAKVEARQKNVADARAWRDALADGLVLSRVPLDQIATDGLPRDRLDLAGVAAADEMDELKASIRAHGQKEPIELYRDREGRLQLKKGWRRLTALTALYAETGEPQFATALARIDETGGHDRLRQYVDMVEENILRQDLTFAEMAQLAIDAALDPDIQDQRPEDMVNRLYASLHKVKRSYIRSFVELLSALGESLPAAKAIPRDLGVEAARALREHPEMRAPLYEALMASSDAETQNALLGDACNGRWAGPEEVAPAPAAPRQDTRQKYEFHVGEAKITARRGEFRIKDATDFTGVPRQRLEEAVRAFQAVLRKG